MDQPQFIPLIAAFDPTDVIKEPGAPGSGSTSGKLDGLSNILLGVVIIFAVGIIWALVFRRRSKGIATTIEGAARSSGQRNRRRTKGKPRRTLAEAGGLPPVRNVPPTDSPPHEPVD
jgi:hypothetical protein